MCIRDSSGTDLFLDTIAPKADMLSDKTDVSAPPSSVESPPDLPHPDHSKRGTDSVSYTHLTSCFVNSILRSAFIYIFLFVAAMCCPSPIFPFLQAFLPQIILSPAHP